MTFKKRINNFRRKLMRKLTQDLSTDVSVEVTVDAAEIKRILICRPNHRLGNMLLITPLVQEIMTTFPSAKIDLMVKGGAAHVIFKNYPSIGSIIQLPKKAFTQPLAYLRSWASLKKSPYDIVINAVRGSSSGRLATKYATARFRFFGYEDDSLQLTYSDYRHIAKYPVYNVRHFLKRLGLSKNEHPVAPLDIKLTDAEIVTGKKLLSELVPNTEKIIGLYTFATGDKCYPPSWWMPFFERLKSEFPDYAFMEILPVENVSQINFTAPAYYSKDVREMCGVMANLTAVIASDSGIMHLAAASQIPTIGLFSVTHPATYQPYGNNSTGIDTNQTDTQGCMAILRTILATA
jgi:heptosyltransferase III